MVRIGESQEKIPRQTAGNTQKTNKKNLPEHQNNQGNLYNFSFNEFENQKPNDPQMPMYTGIDAPKTGGIYAEYDKKTGITTTYNNYTNTITKTGKNGEILSNTDFDGNPVQQKQEENLSKYSIHMADYISGIDDETKSYLKNNKIFTESSNQFIQLEDLKNTTQEKLAIAKKELADAKTNFDNTPYSNFDIKYAAEKKYKEAMKIVQDLQNEIMLAEYEQNKLMKNKMLPYAKTIENWQDGNKIEITTQDKTVRSRVYTQVTLPNGEKAYECNGKYYPLAPNGLPEPEYIEKLHNR